jgi:hypothetical protein
VSTTVEINVYQVPHANVTSSALCVPIIVLVTRQVQLVSMHCYVVYIPEIWRTHLVRKRLAAVLAGRHPGTWTIQAPPTNHDITV